MSKLNLRSTRAKRRNSLYRAYQKTVRTIVRLERKAELLRAEAFRQEQRKRGKFHES